VERKVPSFFQIFSDYPKPTKKSVQICEEMVFLKEVMIKYGPLAYFGVKVPDFEDGSKC
jgi:hypothetical protein